MGSPLGMRMLYPPQLPAGMIHPAIITARMKLYGGDVSKLFSASGADDVLHNTRPKFLGLSDSISLTGLQKRP